MGAKPKTWTPDETKQVRKLAKKLTDVQIADRLNMPRWKVQHIRVREGIAPHILKRPKPWTDERVAEVFRLYVTEGKSCVVVGTALGVSDKAIRAIACKKGWKRDKAHRRANAGRVGTQRATKIRVVRARIAQAAPPPPPPPKKSANDAELIAAFLANRKVTVLPTGHAMGTSGMETAFWAVKPEGSWKQGVTFKKRAVA